MQADWPGVYSIVLNYRTWQFTQGCVESLLVCNYPEHTIVIIDNASPNDSIDHLKSYLDSISLSSQSITSAFPTTRYWTENAAIVLIESTDNNGYAAGNNIGLRWALTQPGMTYFWVLNNDTSVASDAIYALVTHAHTKSLQSMGLVGSLIYNYDQPMVVQTIGEQYNPWTGIAHHVGSGETDLARLPQLIPNISYTIGAACFGSRLFLERVGLMEEDYFLYYEDNDWSMRGQRQGMPDQVCLTSRVYHREGGSTRDRDKPQSALVERCFARNKIRFTKRYFPHCLPTVLLSALGAAIIRVMPRNPRLARELLIIASRELLGLKTRIRP